MAKRGESKHLKRTQVTANIVIPRKKYKFYSRPLPGKHRLERGISMLGLIRDVLKIANNAREAMFLIKNKKISLDGKLVKDGKTITGFGDNVEVCDDSFLIWLDEKGKLIARKIEPINYKLTKIISKRKAEGGKTVFGTSDGQ
ncbi:30S ribosomal protein S4e, partial [Candidatus Parvarchaeota archaeon]|nr:30S ribosomal protein S4e [Candidatus Parvarchaeota archaeon]